MPQVLTAAPAHVEPARPGSWQIGSEPDGWWARERREFLRERLEPVLEDASRVLDSGCGHAGFARELARSEAGFAVACDFQAHGDWVNKPGVLAHVVGDVTRLPFRDGAFDVALALDVIEHFADDQSPLAELRRVTTRPGHVGLAVPALQALWSPYDESVGHYRRYRASELERACRSADLEPTSTTYFFAWLVPPAWLLRRRNRRNADTDRSGPAGRMLGRAIALLARTERAWLRRHRLPFGTSLWSLTSIKESRPC